MDIGDVHPYLIVLLGLDTLGESHGFGLHLSVGIEGRYRLHTLVGRQDGGNATIGIVLELLDGHAAAESPTLRELTRVVEEIAMSLEVGHAAMVRERVGLALGHHHTRIGPGT